MWHALLPPPLLPPLLLLLLCQITSVTPGRRGSDPTHTSARAGQCTAHLTSSSHGGQVGAALRPTGVFMGHARRLPVSVTTALF